MNLDELSNFFTLTAELTIGILAFQGIAVTFIFSRKGEWTYVDVWEFFFVIFTNVTGAVVCVFGICMIIVIDDVKEVLEMTWNFIFVMLAITAFLLVYSDKKIKQRSLIDKKVAEELNTPLTIFFDKIYYVIVFVPFVLPILYYNTNLISIDFVLFWVLASPWIWCAVSFTDFSKLLHHALRIVEEDKLETAGNG